MSRSAFEYLPSVFVGISIGVGALPGLFVTSVLGASGFFFAYALLVYVVTQLLRGRTKKELTLKPRMPRNADLEQPFKNNGELKG